MLVTNLVSLHAASRLQSISRKSVCRLRWGSKLFKEKTALVTGSTSGIGRGIAEQLAAQGANIILNGFGDAAQIEALGSKIAADFGVTVRYDGADLSRQDQIEAMMARALSEFGCIDILVNNAGVQFVAAIDEFPVDTWKTILAVNLSASFHTVRLALPAMKSQGLGTHH